MIAMSIKFRSVDYTSKWIGDRSLLPLDIASNPLCTSDGSGSAHFLLICLVHSAGLMRSFHFDVVPEQAVKLLLLRRHLLLALDQVHGIQPVSHHFIRVVRIPSLIRRLEHGSHYGFWSCLLRASCLHNAGTERRKPIFQPWRNDCSYRKKRQ